jgi:hypothetical protein
VKPVKSEAKHTVGPVLSETMALVLDDCIFLLNTGMSISYARSASTARNGLFSLNLWSTRAEHGSSVHDGVSAAADLLLANELPAGQQRHHSHRGDSSATVYAEDSSKLTRRALARR